MIAAIINAVSTASGAAANARQSEKNRQNATMTAGMNQQAAIEGRSADAPDTSTGQSQPGSGRDLADAFAGTNNEPQTPKQPDMIQPSGVTDANQSKPNPTTTKNSGNDYQQYAQTAGQLASAASSLFGGRGMAPSPLPMAGSPSRFQPTADQFVVKRSPYGGL